MTVEGAMGSGSTRSAPAASMISTARSCRKAAKARSSGWSSYVTRIAGRPHASTSRGSSVIVFVSLGREVPCPVAAIV